MYPITIQHVTMISNNGKKVTNKKTYYNPITTTDAEITLKITSPLKILSKIMLNALHAPSNFMLINFNSHYLLLDSQQSN